jgi:sec-independent protein translocase protein TatC
VLNDFNRWLQDSVSNRRKTKMPGRSNGGAQVRPTRVIVTAIVLSSLFLRDALVKWPAFSPKYVCASTLSWEPTDLPTVPFVFLAPGEALWQNVKVAGLFAVVLATPYILLEFWQFVVPGLHVQERRFVGPFVMLSTLAFLAGVTFSFFFVLPFALNFLISYGVNAGFIPQLSIAQYVGFALWFLLVFGLIFEVPLAITLMAKLGWVDAPFLRRYRKWALLGAFIIAAILTPTPDPFNQCLMALPMYVFYEVGIISAGFFNKKKPAQEEADAADVPPLTPATVAAGAARMSKSGDSEYVGVPTGNPRR